MTPEEIENKADNILAAQAKVNAIHMKCIQAGICPKCGEELIVKEEPYQDVYHKPFLKPRVLRGKYLQTIKCCPTHPAHYSEGTSSGFLTLRELDLREVAKLKKMNRAFILYHFPDDVLDRLLTIKKDVLTQEILESYTDQQIIDLLLETKLIRTSHTFKEGEIICSMENVRRAIPIFFEATDGDIGYSGQYWPCGKKRLYYIIN
jgi:hypothetical protein